MPICKFIVYTINRSVAVIDGNFDIKKTDWKLTEVSEKSQV